MECRYCNKDITSYTDNPWITVTFTDNDKWGYEGKTVRVCGCKGIDPLNKDISAKKRWVVYNKDWQVCHVNPYNDSMMKKSAEISEDEIYRYKLGRIWDASQNKILFIMINPSTANATEDDKTIKLLLEITKKWENYGGFYVGNLYPYRSSKPSELRNVQIPDEIHRKNIKSIQEMSSECSLVIYAWGTKGPDEKQKEPEWLRKIMNRDVYCIGTSVKGVPKHPNQRATYIHLISDIPILFRKLV